MIRNVLPVLRVGLLVAAAFVASFVPRGAAGHAIPKGWYAVTALAAVFVVVAKAQARPQVQDERRYSKPRMPPHAGSGKQR